MTPRAFLREAHSHGDRGPKRLRRRALIINQNRRLPHEHVTTSVLYEAIEMERETEQGRGVMGV